MFIFGPLEPRKGAKRWYNFGDLDFVFKVMRPLIDYSRSTKLSNMMNESRDLENKRKVTNMIPPLSTLPGLKWSKFEQL